MDRPPCLPLCRPRCPTPCQPRTIFVVDWHGVHHAGHHVQQHVSLAQFFFIRHFGHHAGHLVHLQFCKLTNTIRRQDPNNYSDTETRCLVWCVLLLHDSCSGSLGYVAFGSKHRQSLVVLFKQGNSFLLLIHAPINYGLALWNFYSIYFAQSF